MVTIGKLGKGQQTYYLDTVAGGAEDYYAGEGEAPGRWLGAGAAELDLHGEVGREQLTAVLGGHDPRSGEQLPRRLWKHRTPGFDVTFSVPKSVSVLWAIADKETAAAIRDAHERSVDAALGYLEREAAFSRTGAERVPTRGSGFVGAAFRHRTSRAGDPQLHTHVLIANLTRDENGEWRGLPGPRGDRGADGGVGGRLAARGRDGEGCDPQGEGLRDRARRPAGGVAPARGGDGAQAGGRARAQASASREARLTPAL